VRSYHYDKDLVLSSRGIAIEKQLVQVVGRVLKVPQRSPTLFLHHYLSVFFFFFFFFSFHLGWWWEDRELW
jgi:hypothetical protein